MYCYQQIVTEDLSVTNLFSASIFHVATYTVKMHVHVQLNLGLQLGEPLTI